MAPTGVMVGFWLPPETAASLAVAGQLPAETLHLTLCMLEQPSSALTELQLARLLTIVDDLAAWTAPLDGVIGGLGRFYASESSDGQDVAIALVDCPALSKFRERLCDRLCDCGQSFELKDDHGFTPHITLAYVAAGAEMPVAAIPTLPLRFDALTVAVGDKQTTIPLRGYYDGPMCYADAVVLGENHHFLTPLQRYMEPPEWLPLLPAPGKFEHSGYGTIDLPASRIERFVASVNDGVYQASIPINISHNDQDLDLNGALGWFSQARVNADGSADVKVEWTPRGEEAVRDEKFRYVSPEFKATWEDNQKVEHQDVILGLALCTYPFFKDLAIDRAVVASERSAAEPSLSLHYAFSDPVRFVARRTPPASEGPDMSDKTVITDQQFTELKDKHDTLSQQFTELKQRNDELAQKFADSETARTAAETTAQTFKADVDALKAEQRTQRFRALVIGGGPMDKQNPQLFATKAGEPGIAYHIGMLESFNGDTAKEQTYIEEQRAMARALLASAVRPTVGSDAAGVNGGAMAEVNAKAQTYMEANPNVTREQAISAVTEREPELSRRYREEKRQRA